MFHLTCTLAWNKIFTPGFAGYIAYIFIQNVENCKLVFMTFWDHFGISGFVSLFLEKLSIYNTRKIC